MASYHTGPRRVHKDDAEAQKHAQVLSELVKYTEECLRKCEDYADEHGLDFNFEPAYGMGGTYSGKGNSSLTEPDDPYDWNYGESWGWYSSSQSC